MKTEEMEGWNILSMRKFVKETEERVIYALVTKEVKESESAKEALIALETKELVHDFATWFPKISQMDFLPPMVDI